MPWLDGKKIPIVVALTKADKLPKNKRMLEVAKAKKTLGLKRDPIAVWSQKLIVDGMMSEDDVKAMDQSVMEEVEDAYRFAEEAPDPAPEALFRDVYAPEEAS